VIYLAFWVYFFLTAANAAPAIAYARGVQRSDAGDYAGAVSALSESIRLDPAHRDAYVVRGKALHDQGAYRRAVDDFSKAIELDPAYAFAYTCRGDAYTKLGEEGRARADYAEAQRLSQSQRAE
jgi:tetratricopeptide (TPR) repeat protein